MRGRHRVVRKKKWQFTEKSSLPAVRCGAAGRDVYKRQPDRKLNVLTRNGLKLDPHIAKLAVAGIDDVAGCAQLAGKRCV